MEKINIAELLKDCPKGMELDCTVYDNCTLEIVFEGCLYLIQMQTPEGLINLTKYGSMSQSTHYKCIIFPKDKTTWEGFQRPFKDGDIVTSDNFSFIYKNCDTTGIVKSYCGIDTKGNLWKASNRWTTLDKVTFATEEEKQKLFDAIKANGYKWNTETKTLEKLIEPKFKVGDRIKDKNNKKWFVVQVSDKHFSISLVPKAEGYFVPIKNQDDYELVLDKFDITTLKPFDKVLVRDNEKRIWRVDFYSHCNNDEHYKYACVGYTYRQCIPYNEETANLVNTTNDCDDFYKTWEK